MVSNNLSAISIRMRSPLNYVLEFTSGLVRNCSSLLSQMKTCTICGKTFASSSSLSQHKRVHGEKKFTCIHCGKGFIRKGRYEKHLKNHHQEAACAAECTDALNGTARRVTFTPISPSRDPLSFLSSYKHEVLALLEAELDKRKGLKFYICLQVCTA